MAKRCSSTVIKQLVEFLFWKLSYKVIGEFTVRTICRFSFFSKLLSMDDFCDSQDRRN